jgi:transcription elongation factor Elf1
MPLNVRRSIKRKRTPVNLPICCILCGDRDLGDLKVNSETILVSCSSCDQDSPFNLYDAAQLASCLTGSNDMKVGTSAYAAKSAHTSTIVAMHEASNT